MDAWRNCKNQSDIVSGCRLSHCIPRPGTALPRPVYRVPGHHSCLALRAAQACKAQQVIFKQIQVTAFLLSLVSGTVWMLQGLKHRATEPAGDRSSDSSALPALF